MHPAVKLIGKLQDGTVFVKKGHDGDALLEFKTDEGKYWNDCLLVINFMYELYIYSIVVGRASY